MSDMLAKFLRDQIADLLAGDIEPGSDASVEALDENGVHKIMVIDEDANCYRVTVELI